MLRNKSIRQTPDWMQPILEQLLTPPSFIQTPIQEERTRQRTSVKKVVTPSRSAPHFSAHGNSTSSVRTKRTPESENPIHVDSSRMRRAVLTQLDLPESVIYRYPWNMTNVSRIRNVAKVETDEGDFALKRTHATAKHVKFLSQAMEYARGKGFSQFADIVRTKSDRPYVTDESGTYYATRWLKGPHASFTSTGQIGKVAKALASWHEVTRGFRKDGYQPDPEFGMHRMLQTRRNDLLQLLERAENARDRDEFDQMLASLATDLKKDADRSVELANQPAIWKFLKEDMKQPGLCHLDVIPSNFVYDRDETMNLIDLDLTTFAPRSLDIFHLLRRCLERTHWDTEVAYTTFYEFNEVREIEVSEYALIRALLTFPYRVWRLAHTRYHVFKDGEQIDDLRQARDGEHRRHTFLDSYAKQIPQGDE